MKRAKNLDVTFATCDDSNPFLTAYRCYCKGGIDSIVVRHFGEMNKGFKQLIYSLAKVTTESQEAENTTLTTSRIIKGEVLIIREDI